MKNNEVIPDTIELSSQLINALRGLTNPKQIEDLINQGALLELKKLTPHATEPPTSHQLMRHSDEFTNRMLSAINDLMLDMLAAVARKDYQDRRRRQKEGISKAKNQGKYKGRGENAELHKKIEMLLQEGKSYTTIMHLITCSRGTIAKVAKQFKLLEN